MSDTFNRSGGSPPASKSAVTTDQPSSVAAKPLEPTYEGDFVLDGPLPLDCGRSLNCPTLHYAVYGRLNAARDNAVLVCHALSGSARVGNWWPEIFAPGAVLSLERDFVICINMLGSCYGSTGPGSVNPDTGQSYGPDFPLVGVRDNVKAQARLLDSLGIRRLRFVLGGSIGGMQALEWSILHPDRVQRALIIGVTPLSAMGIALNHLQRQAIQHDPEWAGGRYLPQRPPRRGLALARQIAMISYKSAPLFDERYGRNPNQRTGEDPWSANGNGSGLTGGRFDIAGYLDHQGQRFIERFDANAYLAILRAMDTWDPLRGFASAEEAFGRIRARLSFIGISSDWLFPAGDVHQFAEAIRIAGAQADYREMTTAHGHDAFLAEQTELVRLLQ
jgi:homoserine O-acetyltransferase/O-succinyltransferase